MLGRSPGLNCQLYTPGTLLLVESGGHVGPLSWVGLSAAQLRYFIAGVVWRPCLELSPGLSCQLHTSGTLLLVWSGGHVWSALLG